MRRFRFQVPYENYPEKTQVPQLSLLIFSGSRTYLSPLTAPLRLPYSNTILYFSHLVLTLSVSKDRIPPICWVESPSLPSLAYCLLASFQICLVNSLPPLLHPTHNLCCSQTPLLKLLRSNAYACHYITDYSILPIGEVHPSSLSHFCPPFQVQLYHHLVNSSSMFSS